MTIARLHVTMPDGSVWAVPAELIAQSRANYYAKLDSATVTGDEYRWVYGETFAETLRDEDCLIDWAANNMNWSDVAHAAVRVERPAQPVDFQEGWVNGPKWLVENDA